MFINANEGVGCQTKVAPKLQNEAGQDTGAKLSLSRFRRFS